MMFGNSKSCCIFHRFALYVVDRVALAYNVGLQIAVLSFILGVLTRRFVFLLTEVETIGCFIFIKVLNYQESEYTSNGKLMTYPY